MEVISSRKNPLVGQMRQAAEGGPAGRDRMLLDGLHLIEEARAARVAIVCAAFSARALATADGRARRLATQLAGTGVRVVQVSDAVMHAMSLAANPPGAVAIASRPQATLDDALAPAPALAIVAIDVQDPGNLGAMTRVAEAGGATGLLACGTSADPFGWKALRGSMGSALRLPIARQAGIDEVLSALRGRGIALVATAPDAPTAFDRHGWTRPTAILLGSEGGGLPAAIVEACDVRVAIPMRSPVESLNVAVTAGLLVYEARRQRAAARGTRA